MNKLTATAGAAVTELDERTSTERHRAGDEGTHFPSAVTETPPAAVMP